MVLPATLLVWTTLLIILVLFWGTFFIARASGQFDDLEQVKHQVFKDVKDEEGK